MFQLQDNKARICRAVNDVIYKGDAADVVVVCDKQLHTIPFDAYQRAERFAAVWGGFKKVRLSSLWSSHGSFRSMKMSSGNVLRWR